MTTIPDITPCSECAAEPCSDCEVAILTQRIDELTRENTELRTKLDAIGKLCGPKPEPAKPTKKAVPAETKSALPTTLDVQAFQEAWANWLTYRRQAKFKSYTEIGEKMQLQQLAKLGSARAVAAIIHSIAQGWQGIHEPKEQTAPLFGARPPTAAPVDPVGWREFLQREKRPYEAHQYSPSFLRATFSERKTRRSEA